jgi:hypothetical protein
MRRLRPMRERTTTAVRAACARPQPGLPGRIGASIARPEKRSSPMRSV